MKKVTFFYPNGYKDHIELADTLLICQIIDQLLVKNAEMIPKEHSPRLIYKGRILSGNESLNSLEMEEEFTIHVFFQIKSQNSDPIDIIELRGFQRLFRMNFTAERIEMLQYIFHERYGSLDRSEEERILLEDEWFPILFNQIINNDNLDAFEIPNNNENTQDINDSPYISFVLGTFLGLIFGLASLSFSIIFYQNKWILFGQGFGTLINVSILFYLGIFRKLFGIF